MRLLIGKCRAGCSGAAAVVAPAMPRAPSPFPASSRKRRSAGINSVYAGEWEYMVGGGVATFDCNDDGFPDMLLAGGEAPAKFYRNASDARRRACISRRETSGLELDTVTGAYPLDIDSDGITDLVLLRVGENVVMRGLGDCRFERANEAWGFDGGDAWSTAFAATWEQGAQLADAGDRQLHRPQRRDFALGLLHRQLAAPASRRWHSGAEIRRAAAAEAELLRALDAVHRLEPVRHAVPARLQRPRILRGRPGAALARRAGQAACALHRRRRLEALAHLGHGHRQRRPRRRRLPGIFPDQHGRQQAADAGRHPAGRQAAAPTFKDVAFAKGVTAHRPYMGGDLRPSTAWHAQFEDVNNDGLVDLFIAKGNVAEMPDFATQRPQQPAPADRRRQIPGSGRRRRRREHLHLARRGARRFQSRRAGGSGRGQPLEDARSSGATPAAMPARGSRSGCSRTAPTATASARGSKCKRGDTIMRRENHRRRRPCQRPERLVAFRARRSTPRRSARRLAGWRKRRMAECRRQRLLSASARQAGNAVAAQIETAP